MAGCVRACGLTVLVGASLAGSAGAHDLGRSESSLTLAGPREIRAALTLNLLDFPSLADLDRNRDQAFSYDELDRGVDRLYVIVRAHVEIGGPQPPSSVSLDRYERLDDTAIRLDLTYRFASDVARLRVGSSLDQATAPGHVHVTTLVAGGATRQAVLTAGVREATFEIPGGWSFATLLRVAALLAAIVSLVLYGLVRRAALS
jgi:hypothetical protein